MLSVPKPREISSLEPWAVRGIGETTLPICINQYSKRDVKLTLTIVHSPTFPVGEKINKNY